MLKNFLKAWALPFSPLGTSGLWLHHTIRLLEVLSVATLLYAAGLPKLIAPRRPWAGPLKQAAMIAYINDFLLIFSG